MLEILLQFLFCSNKKEAAMTTVSLPDFRSISDTDDNSALAAALAAGQRVYLPAGQGTGPSGEYQLGTNEGTYSTPLAGNLVSGADLFGDGMGESRILQIGSFALMANSLSDDVANNLTNISIRNLTIENQGYEGSNLVDIGGVTGFVAERVEFLGFPLDGLYIGSSNFTGVEHERHNEQVTIRDCIFDGNGSEGRRNGISILDCVDWLIENCEFVDTSHEGMPGAIDVEPNTGFDFYRVRNGRIVGCRFRDIQFGRAVSLLLGASPELILPIKNISVDECTIEDSAGGFGVSGYAGTDAATATEDHGVSFRGNYMKNVGSPFLFNGALGVDFANNRVEDCDMSGLGSGASSRKIRIVDNDFVRCGKDNGPTFVQDSSLADADIAGNRFLDCGVAAGGPFGPIYFLRGVSANLDRIRIVGNRIESPTGRTTHLALKVGGYAGTINSGDSQKTGNEFIGFTPSADNML
jgi:hypothetical protein